MDGDDNSDKDEGIESTDEISADEDEMSTNDGDEDEDDSINEPRIQTYVPIIGEDAEKLDCDESAYILYHRAQTGAPCLSFDVIPDELGGDRQDDFPLSCHLVSGTQAERTHANHLLVMRMSNMHRNKLPKEKSEESESDEESEDEEDQTRLPQFTSVQIKHPGCVNRVRVTAVHGRTMAASWSELHHVYIWDLTPALEAVKDKQKMATYTRNSAQTQPVFTFKGHTAEGFAIDWTTLKPGVLATGDCHKNIHLWTPMEGATWHVDQRPFTGHTGSVEDLQWSPSEANVLASCSVDKSIRIWDMRAAPNKACMLTAEDAHASDVNVINWNHLEPFIVSGGDDGVIKVWDLRQFQSKSPVATFKHHREAITSVEWHPTDSSVYAASGADDQLTLWDLAVERDQEAAEDEQEVRELPPQLLFIHQGQKDIKELHWHPQMSGVLISTAQSGFNIFRTISV